MEILLPRDQVKRSQQLPVQEFCPVFSAMFTACSKNITTLFFGGE